jgi:hypothetical protein
MPSNRWSIRIIPFPQGIVRCNMWTREDKCNRLLNACLIEAPPRRFDGSLVPAPSADSCRLAAWLNRIRLGVVISITLLAIGAAFMMPFLNVPNLDGVMIAFFGIGGIAATWLMLTPEPDNAKWLRKTRWLTRVMTIVVAAFAILLIAWPAGKNMHAVLGLANGALWCSYMKHVSERMGDEVSRRVFGVVKWFSLWMLALCAIVLAADALGPEMLAPSASADAAGPAEKGHSWLSLGLWVSMGIAALSLWFMLRLARRTKCCAEYYLNLWKSGRGGGRAG